jgi:CheY-like chemotaxis protein
MSDLPEPEHLGSVLVVEDDPLIRLTLSDYLQDHGFKVLEAGTGDEALAVIAAPAFAVDLIFTDVMMPGLTDGFALAEWMAENQPDIPVIITSGDDEKKALAQEQKRFRFIPKPYELEDVAKQIRDALDNKKSERRAAK